MGEIVEKYVEAWTCKACGAKLQERETWVHVGWLAWDDASDVVKDDEAVRRFCDSRCLTQWLVTQRLNEDMTRGMR